MRILELSIGPTQEFHFDYIKNKYGNKSRLLFTDTDRLVYDLEKLKMLMTTLVKIKKF